MNKRRCSCRFTCARKGIGSILIGIILCLLAGQAEASIILKTMVVNPSKTKTQTALLKAYLPKETKPEDIVELGDLKIDYDVEKTLYYVYKEFDLEPGESVSRSIEIKDVWIISQSELDSLTGRAKELVEALKKTAYFDTAITLQKDIEQKSSDVLEKQEQAMDALPQTHIAVYRDNVEALGSIKQVLARLEKLVIESKVAAGAATERVSVKATWWVILGVIVALGLLSLAFFIIWHRQAGITALKQKEEEEEEAKTKEPPPPVQPDRRKGK
ncbi:MAG: hypothetical protein KKH11_02670 [Candidatus Omnitrophica bacterium]|nr:hypothetical protein [Candidatus Omnitrophota bacterium]